MRFQADHAVEDLHTGFLQIARPANVGSFVETSFELKDDGDFLFCRGFDQSADDGRVFTGAIEGLADGENVRVVGSTFNEANDGGIGVVGMVQQHVALSKQVEQRAGLRLQRQLPGNKWAIFQVRARNGFVQIGDARKIGRPVHTKNLPGSETKIGYQAFNNLLIRAGFDFQADGFTFSAAVKLGINRIHDAARFFGLEIKITVTSNAKGSSGKYFVSVIEALGESVNYVGKKNVFDRAVGGGQLHQARESARHGDNSEVGLRATPFATQ